MDPSWGVGDQLRPTIYEFMATLCPQSLVNVLQSQLQPQATTFRNALLRRQPRCIISGMEVPVIASHIIPRRLGDSGVQSVIRRFTSTPPPPPHVIQSMGITLVDIWTIIYKVGFWNTGPVSHLAFHTRIAFTGVSSSGPICGSQFHQPDSGYYPLLHRQDITLTRHDLSVANPLTGLFNRHYIQCVLKRFRTP
jgi:hypothetical protein